MIAANHMKHIEALRFQHEMFFKGYRNQPRFMRIMQCVFDQTPSTPDWWKAAKAQARKLAKSIEKAIMPMFDQAGNVTWTFKKINTLNDVELINLGELGRVKRKGIKTPEELADLSPNELMQMGRMRFEKAYQIIKRLRDMLWA